MRELQTPDIPALARLAARTFRATFAGSFADSEIEPYIAETRSEDALRAAMRTDTFLGAEIDGVLAGYIQLCDVRLAVKGYTPSPRDQAINALYVAPEHQGRGIGRALMDAALAHERFAGAGTVLLDVWEENRRAVKFYRACGFKPVGTVDVVAGGRIVGEDLVLARPTPRKDRR